MSLFGLTKDYMQVKMAMDSMLSDDAAADTEAYEMTLESMKELVSENSVGLAKYAKELEAIAKFQKDEAKALAAEAKKTEAKAEKLLKSIGDCLKLMDLTEVQAGAYKFKFKKGSEITLVNEDELPAAYFTEKTVVERKPLPKDELKKLVKGGLSIKGVQVVRNPDKLELK